MKVLFVDYIYQKGHVNFNQIHINALRDAGCDVRMVLYEDIAKQLPFEASSYALVLPNILKQRKGHPLFNRICFLLALFLIKIKINVSNYDKVIVSSCDEITMGLMPLCKGMYIICHCPDMFGNKVKRFFGKRLARKNSFIVFNETMTLPFKRNGIYNVFIVNHGCMPPFKISNVGMPKEFMSFDGIIFHPSMSPDLSFVTDLVSNERLNRFLSENNVLLVLRNQPEGVKETKNIIFINDYLTRDQYQHIFMTSDVILLAYPKSFNYRVSGVSFECIANNKKVLILDNPSLRYTMDFYNYNPMFADVDELCERLEFLHSHKDVGMTVSFENLAPDYKMILND